MVPFHPEILGRGKRGWKTLAELLAADGECDTIFHGNITLTDFMENANPYKDKLNAWSSHAYLGCNH